MSTINDSISRVRTLLLNPNEQAPTLDQVFTHLGYEFQNYYNELDSSSLPWTMNEQTITVTSGETDYLVVTPPGKILFAVAYPENDDYAPFSLEIADLAEVSSDFYLYSPLDWGYSPDFNELITFPWPFQIAFYRKDGDLWFRLAPFAYNIQSVKLTYSTGDWLSNLQTTDTAVLPQYHALVEVRTALNLLPAAQWSGNEDANQNRRANLGKTLAIQEDRYAQQFLYGRRNMSVPETTTRHSPLGGWG